MGEKKRPLRKKLSREACPTVDGVHRINSLPDDIILHILSFLPTRDAIRTSILSRRWKYLWTSMSDIKLEEFGYSSLDFLEFVDGVLRQHDSSDITRLILIVRYTCVSSFRIHSWISTAITHNIQHLDLTLPASTTHSVPCSLFTCQSLCFLSLDFHGFLQTPTSVHLSHLKTLWLCHVEFVDGKSAESLFSGCPVLEELQLRKCGWNNIKDIKIAIPNLKKLDIRPLVVRGHRPRGVINIYVPNLISLDYCYTVWGVEFYLHDLCSLVDASIKGIGPLGRNDHENARRLLNVVASAYNVKSLEIGEDNSLEALEEVADRLPTFHNLTNFTMSSGLSARAIPCRALMDLLEKMPNLTCIHFDGGLESSFVEFEVEDEQYIFERVATCVENSLEKVVISGFTGQRKELYIMRCFLTNAKRLEKITLYFDDLSDKKRLAPKLRTLRKGAGKCLIEFLKKRFVPTRYC